MHKPAFAALTALGLLTAFPAAAEQTTTVTITIEENQFQPAEIVVPAGEPVQLVVKNEDTTPEEFESHSLHQEKIIMGGSVGRFSLGPLEPGRYEFFGEFHPETARGVLVAK